MEAVCADDPLHWFGVNQAGPGEGRGVEGTAERVCKLSGVIVGRKRVMMLEKGKLRAGARACQQQVPREWPQGYFFPLGHSKAGGEVRAGVDSGRG